MEERKEIPPFVPKGVWVCVDRSGNYDLAGRLYSIASGRGTKFENIADLLLKIDGLLDFQKAPQAFQRTRSFQKKAGSEGAGKEKRWELREESVLDQRGEYATCNIHVESRMHTSWQGTVRDVKGRLLGVFESELGLIEILLRGNM